MPRVMLCLLLLFVTLPSSRARAQAWKISSDINLTLTQNAYSNNWEGGESGSLAWTLNSNTIAERQVLARVFNKNTLKLAYGLTYNQDPQTDKWGSGDKSTDLIDLESTFRITLGTFLEPIVAFRGITQFLDQSDPAQERWVNPLELTESIGITRVFTKTKTREWQARMGAAAKQIINRDALDPLDPGSSVRETRVETDEGLEFVHDLITQVGSPDLVLTSKLTVFQAILSSVSDDSEGTAQANDWKYPDINFENILSAAVTKYVSVNLYVQLLYDRQIDRGARFKQTLSMGLTYKLM